MEEITPMNRTQCAKTKEYYGLGFNDDEICSMLEVSMQRLTQTVEKSPSLRLAKEMGTKMMSLRVTEALMHSAMGTRTKTKTLKVRKAADGTEIGTEETVTTTEVAPNLAAIKMWLENKTDDWANLIDNAEKNLNVNVTVDGKSITVNKKTDNISPHAEA